MTTLATEKQISFVSDLLAKREVAAEIAERIADAIDSGEYTRTAASGDIDTLLSAPKRAAAPSPIQKLLATVPKSKYAIPTDELIGSDVDGDFNGDLVFIELREYMSTLYVRQLHGAPGRFNRSKMTVDQTTTLINLVAADPYKYAKLFGDHYACCGSCGAELTDQRSRELMLGPECRKKFGF